MSAKMTVKGSVQGQTPPSGGTITMGNSTVFTNSDDSNANLLLASSTPLSTAGTLQSLSFYARVAGGSLRLGVYSDANGPSKLLASTNSFTPVVGWNTQVITSQVQLAAGTYWLAYLPSSNSLGFVKAQTGGGSKWASFTFGAMPATFPTPTGGDPYQWSFYGTLSTAPPATKPTYTAWDTKMQAFILTGAAPAQSPAQLTAWLNANPPTPD